MNASPAVKLSAKQKEVITQLRNGYSISLSHVFECSASLNNSGCKQINLNKKTFTAMCDNGLIKCTEKSFPISTYNLTELGKNIEL